MGFADSARNQKTKGKTVEEKLGNENVAMIEIDCSLDFGFLGFLRCGDFDVKGETPEKGGGLAYFMCCASGLSAFFWGK